MKKILIFLNLLLSLNVFGQQNSCDLICFQSPTFGDGKYDSALKFIYSRIVYPEKAIVEGLEGKLFVQFIVTEKGETEDIKIMKSHIGGGCEEEVLRVVALMKDWHPIIQNGKPTKSKVTLPITFKLEDPKPEEVKH
jgi:TonB family protein